MNEWGRGAAEVGLGSGLGSGEVGAVEWPALQIPRECRVETQHLFTIYIRYIYFGFCWNIFSWVGSRSGPVGPGR
jgi:hypothetical protein